MYTEFTENMMTEYPPTLAIVVYESDSERDYYLESHEIVGGQLMEGKPLSEETIFGIAELFKEKGITQCDISGIFPANLLYFEKLHGSNYNMAWYRPAEQRDIHFHENLHIPDGRVWVPPLIYRVNGGQLHVMALSSNERPELTSILYKAPFHNTSDNGSVCLGSAKARRDGKKTYQSEIEYWETLFWNSKFSHLAAGGNPTKSNLNVIWMDQVSKGTVFPMGELIETKLTLKKFI